MDLSLRTSSVGIQIDTGGFSCERLPARTNTPPLSHEIIPARPLPKVEPYRCIPEPRPLQNPARYYHLHELV